MNESIEKRFSLVNRGQYYIDLGSSIRDIFGFDFEYLNDFDVARSYAYRYNIGKVGKCTVSVLPVYSGLMCLKRGDDGIDSYRYKYFGFCLKGVVTVSRHRGVMSFVFPNRLRGELGVSKDVVGMYVHYSDDGSIHMSKDKPVFCDYVESVEFWSSMFISKSLDTYMASSFYAIPISAGSFILVPTGSAMWSFIGLRSGRYYLFADDIYYFVARRDSGGEFVVVRYLNAKPEEFEVVNNVRC